MGRLGHFDFQQASQVGNGLSLECRQITTRIFELGRADLAEAFRINQNHRQMRARAFPPDTPFDHHRSSEFAEGGRWIVNFAIADYTGGNHPKRLLSGLQVRQFVG